MRTTTTSAGTEAGGCLSTFGEHIGIRGDIRYFHAFSAAEFLGIDLAETKLDYGRVSGALLVKF